MSQSGRTVRVGFFVLVALALATLAVFMIEDTKRGFDRKMTFTARFTDVAGLKAGSPVRMGGIDVGAVTSVRHADKPEDTFGYVTFSVARREATRVRQDTVAHIVGKGFLGDKMVVLEGGVGAAATDDSEIASEREPKDLSKTFDKLESIADKADDTMAALKRTSEQLGDPQLAEDVRGSTKALHEILDGIAHQDGAAHRFIFDKEQGRKVDEIIKNLDIASANFARASTDAREVAARARTGPGLVHTLVYDDEMARGVSGTMVELNNSLKAIRTGNGLMHAVVYGDDTTQHVMGNVNAMSDDLREIVANVKAGRGTIGAFLVDPSVYEDVKSLVGNVERNQVLRALVRYSIKQNEEKPHADVKDAPQPVAAPTPK